VLQAYPFFISVTSSFIDGPFAQFDSD